MGPDPKSPTEDISYLLDVILDQIKPAVYNEGTLQMRITSLDYSSFVGRIAIGRVARGTVKAGQYVSMIKRDGSIKKMRIKEIYTFEGIGREKTEEPIRSGDLCAIVGIEGFDIGDTICDADNPEPLPAVKIDEPTMSMLFTINTSPFFGKEGKFVTSRHLRDRLFKEIEKNLALRVDETESPESLNVYGRGILHLSVLIETMRREGYELQLGQPRVITKIIDGIKHEPMEELTIHVPEEFSGKVIEAVTMRKGELTSMDTKNDRVHIVFMIPSRGLIGINNQVLTATEGQAVISHRFHSFGPWKGDMQKRFSGALISMETGPVVAYSLDKLQDRGKFFVGPGEDIYEGQVIGEHIREADLVININKGKQLTNMRASGTDSKSSIAPPVRFSLEEYMEYIRADEYLEVTPISLRLRKIVLDENERKRSSKN